MFFDEVFIRADISRLVIEIDSSGVEKATKKLGEFSKSSKQAKDGVDKLTKSFGNLGGNKLKETETNINSLDDIFKNFNLTTIASNAGILSLVVAFKKLTTSIIQFGKTCLNNYAYFEKMEMGLTTFFHSAERGKSTFEQLRKLSNETTYGMEELAEAYTMLANAGGDVSTMKDTLLMLGNIAQGDKEKFMDISRIYSKVIVQGRAYAEHIEMLQNRGIPLRKTLKELGYSEGITNMDRQAVTLDRVTEAFKKLTSESGQFYNAMNNINDTIIGKEGFIRDYFREMTVNFAEVTGLADAYKAVLTGLKDALAWFSNTLLALNDDPLMKALFTGTLIGILTAIAGVVGSLIVGAIKKVIVQLKTTVILQSALQTLMGNYKNVLLAVGVVSAGAFGISLIQSRIEKQEELNKKIKDEIDLHTKLEKILGGLNEKSSESELKTGIDALIENQTKKQQEIQKTIDKKLNINFGGKKNADKLRGLILGDSFNNSDLDKGFNIVKNKIQEVTKELENTEKKYGGKDVISAYLKSDYQPSAIIDYEYNLNLLNDLKKTAQEISEIKLLNLNKDTLNQQKEIQNSFNKMRDNVTKDSPFTKNLKDIESAKSLLNELNTTAKTEKTVVKAGFDKKTGQYTYKQDILYNVDPKYKEEIDEAVWYVQNKIRELDGLPKLEKWREYWKAVTGLEVADSVLKGISGKQIGELTVQQISDKYSRQAEVNEYLTQKTGYGKGVNYSRNALEEELQQLVGIYQQALNERSKLQGDDRIEFDDNVLAPMEKKIAAINKELDKFKTVMEKLQETINENYKKLAKGDNSVAGAILGQQIGLNMMNSSNDFSNFANGMAQAGGNPIGGVVNMVASSFSEVASSVEGMDKVLNPFTAVMETLTSLFELIVGVMEPFFTTLDGIKNVLSAIVEGVLRPFQPLIELIAGAFELLANMFTELFNSLDPIIEVISMIVDTILNAISTALDPLIQTFRMIGELLNIFTVLFKPIMTLLNTFSKLLTLLSAPIRILARLFELVASVLEAFFKPFIDLLEGFMDWIDDFMGNGDDEEEEEEKQATDLRDAYKALLQAMKENEEYYESRRKELRAIANVADVTGVHDMILTPQGNFSTDPDDYIIATKTPNELGGRSGSLSMNVNINNTISDKVAVTTQKGIGEDGLPQLIVQISQKVAQDYASGQNGWDSAMLSQQSRMRGRSLVM